MRSRLGDGGNPCIVPGAPTLPKTFGPGTTRTRLMRRSERLPEAGPMLIQMPWPLQFTVPAKKELGRR